MSDVTRSSAIEFRSDETASGLRIVAREIETAISALEEARLLAVNCTGTRVSLSIERQDALRGERISLSPADARLAARRLMAEADKCDLMGEQTEGDESGFRRCPARTPAPTSGSRSRPTGSGPDQSAGERRPEAPSPQSRPQWHV